MQSPKLWKERSHVKLPPNIILCLAPFLWALPTVIVAIPTLQYKKRHDYPGIYFTPVSCAVMSAPTRCNSPLTLAAMLFSRVP